MQAVKPGVRILLNQRVQHRASRQATGQQKLRGSFPNVIRTNEGLQILKRICLTRIRTPTRPSPRTRSQFKVEIKRHFGSLKHSAHSQSTELKTNKHNSTKRPIEKSMESSIESVSNLGSFGYETLLRTRLNGAMENMPQVIALKYRHFFQMLLVAQKHCPDLGSWCRHEYTP
jgi:hypothetical protein